MLNGNPISKRILNLPGYIIVSLLTISLCFSINTIYTNYSNSYAAPQVTIEIEDGYPVSGLNTYCNGVYLGKTPLRIPLAELKEKVPKWKTPPRQERIQFSRTGSETFTAIPEQEYDLLKATYAPRDRALKNTNIHFYSYTGKQIKEYLPGSHYWFQYKKNGCLAHLRMDHGASGSNSRGNKITRSFHPNAEFPSLNEHIQTILFALRQTDYKPTKEWIDHVLEYKDMLFHELVWRCEDNPHLQPVIDTLVRAEFNIPDKANHDDCKRIVDEILNRAEERRGFSVPSLESYALDIVAPLVPEYISQCYERALEYPSSNYRTSGNSFGDKPLILYSREGKSNRQCPLEYAIKRYHPPQIFNRLVYEYANRKNRDRTIILIANYPGEKSLRLFQDYLNHLSGKRRPSFYHFTEIMNPELDRTIVDFMANNSRQSFQSDLRRFLESRIGQKMDQKELALRIGSLINEEYNQLDFLSRIHDESAYEQIKSLIGSNDDRRINLIFDLAKRPNPFFEQFLLDTYTVYQKDPDRQSGTDALLRALYRTNTKKTRNVIIELWNNYPEDRKYFLRPFQDWEWPDSVLNEWTGFLSKIAETGRRKQAIEILAKTDTTASWKIIQQWSNDENREVRTAAQTVIQQREEKLQRAQQLITGQLHPDDLLPPAQAYVWDEENYVKEQQ